MRQNTLDTVFYGVLLPESRYTYAGVEYVTPERLLSASKTNMPALYTSEKVARSYNGNDANVIKVKVVRA